MPAIALTLQTTIISEGAWLYATQATLRRISPDNSVDFAGKFIGKHTRRAHITGIITAGGG